MVKAENLPRNQWALARVARVFEDPKDNLVRRVELITQASSSVMRPISKLVLLVEGDSECEVPHPVTITEA